MKERLLLKTRTMPQEEIKSTKQDDSKIIMKAMVLIAVTTMAKPKDVRDFLCTSHNNHKETY